MEKLIELINKYNLGIVIEEECFKNLTTIGIGGKIKYLYYPNTINSLKIVYKYILLKKIKYFIIGNGSNIIVSDEYFNGIVISLKNLDKYSVSFDKISIEAGAKNTLLVKLIKSNIGGFEEIATIPGTIGGLIYNNAGCFNKCISDLLIDVTVLDNTGNVMVLKNEDVKFSYRNSIFKTKNYLILKATFKVNHNSNYEYYKYLMNERRKKQPIGQKSSGSTFKNSNQLPAWKIIENLNLKGYSINDALISTKHSNFIINKANASFKDILSLINLIKELAKEKGYELELEVEIIDFNR